MASVLTKRTCPNLVQYGRKPIKQAPGYWENKENILNFLSKIKEKYKLNTPDDWNSITTNHIQSNGGTTLLTKYSIFELKCMACPEGKSNFNSQYKSSGYWENKKNIQNFLWQVKQKYNLNTPEDWNSITQEHIKSHGGKSLLNKYSLFELKCMACPEGQQIFNNPRQASGHWDINENVHNFLSQIKQKYNLNTSEDWNSITKRNIQANGGGTLLNKYSLYELKCMACPEGKSSLNNPKHSAGYWENKENIQKFLSEIKEKYNLQTPEDWNSITQKNIQENGGNTLLSKFSMFELKCMACPEGKSIYNNSKQTSGYWENKENILKFLYEIKEKYNLTTTEDWNLITHKHLKLNGGGTLLAKYSIFELKCMACPEGKSSFKNPHQAAVFWENEDNIHQFFSKLKEKYNLNSPEDWKRISKRQIISEGGSGILNNKNYLDIKIKFEISDQETKFIPLSNLVSGYSAQKRSSQRWLFLQVQKLFPHEEIVEDYFHSEISRISGFNVQFDIFMIGRNIAIEYHGKQHYEDMPAGFSTLETYQQRDIEKENICKEHGIQLIVIPYWWNNNLDSLKTYLYSKINL